MTVECNETAEGKSLQIKGSPDIYAAGPLHETLKHFVESHSTISIDLSEIESCDLTTLQLLCATRRSCERVGKTFHLKNSSPAVVQAAKRLGITEEQLGLGVAKL